MAVLSKKDKLVEEVQKFVARGQLDKAIKTYEQILVMEPSAINQRQKLAELLIKSGRNDDARKEFETIGKHFSKNGFYLKAIAVYKQLQKLFPADISLSLTLAELNEKHGLIANSLSEYKHVYEFYEKNGNITEALAILDRMQNVDPQNIPIKIKLAEAYIQQGKKKESYSVFAKTASLLLERSDNITFAKITARVLQLFPDKPDFMLEVITEQIAQGNASIIIGTLQNLLRSDPQNKRVWSLIIKTYKKLEQPQRIKVAYQHYLKFFPSEPEAILGLITSFTEEQDLAEALRLLELYESNLISAGFLQQLEQVYKSLEKIEPINTTILQGLIRVATAAGDQNEVLSLTEKLKPLYSLSTGKSQKPAIENEPLPGIFDTPAHSQPPDSINISSPFGESQSEQSRIPAFNDIASDTSQIMVPGPSPFSDFEDVIPPSDEEIEIDIDIDSPFNFLEQDSDNPSSDNNWLDSVSNLFDAISTVSGGVKFGAEMDSSDAQSHFDLGQAFREMGLYDEAINEFRKASQDSAKRIECMIMQCACLRERGEVDKAITMLQALMKPGLSIEESCSVKYELATGYETIGKQEDANIQLTEIDAINPGFRDISSRLNAANRPESIDFSDDDLKDF